MAVRTDPYAPAGRVHPVTALAPLVAGASAGAGAIHLAMVSAHSEELIDALGFAAAGWFQLAFAVLALTRRPPRVALVLAIVANAALIGLWAWSRTAGLPVGAHEGIAEPVGAIDLVAVALQAVVIVAACAWLALPDRQLLPSPVSAVAGLAAVALASVVIVSPDTTTLGAAGHAHGTGALASGGDGHDHGAAAATGPAAHAAEMALVEQQRCDWEFNPVSYYEEARVLGIDTTAGGAMSADHHGDSGSGVVASVVPDRLSGRGSYQLDKLVSLTSQAVSEVAAGRLVAELARSSDAEYAAWLDWLVATGQVGHAHDSHASAAPDDTGGHGGHVGPHTWKALVDPADCEALAAEIELARETALKYPTAADATAAGWFRVTPYLPGIAAHYMNFRYVDDRFEIDKPEMILYDGNGPDARVVGLSYYVTLPGSAEPTQGFTGDNDHYHRHIGLCVGAGGVIGDSTTTPEECAAMGGVKQDGSAGWMSHAWVVPGCESPWGLFSGANPILDDALARESGKNDGGCAASSVRDRYDLSPGRAPQAAGVDASGVASGR